MTSKCNQEEAAEMDTIGEQQLKGVQLGMKWMQLGSSWVWLHETSAHQWHYRTRVLVCQSRGLRQAHYEGGETSA